MLLFILLVLSCVLTAAVCMSHFPHSFLFVCLFVFFPLSCKSFVMLLIPLWLKMIWHCLSSCIASGSCFSVLLPVFSRPPTPWLSVLLWPRFSKREIVRILSSCVMARLRNSALSFQTIWSQRDFENKNRMRLSRIVFWSLSWFGWTRSTITWRDF